jgi:AraC family ethanolamine operon transcriptional activator
VDEVAALFPSRDLRVLQLAAGELHVLARFVQVPGVAVRWLHTDRSIQARGRPRGAQFVFTPITQANEGWRFCGRLLRDGDIRIVRPGEDLDEIYSTNSEGLSIVVNEDLLRRALASDVRGQGLGAVLGHPAFRPTAAAFRNFVLRLDRLSRLWMDNPGRLSQEELAARVRNGYVEEVAAVLQHDTRDSDLDRLNCVRQDVARDAERIMDCHLNLSLTTVQLCRELTISRRTLFYAFRDTFGMSPMAYYKIKRLNAVRRELKQADPVKTMVREVSRNWGFRHQGQFARDYTRQFGERPLETLVKRKLTGAAGGHGTASAGVAPVQASRAGTAPETTQPGGAG